MTGTEIRFRDEEVRQEEEASPCISDSEVDLKNSSWLQKGEQSQIRAVCILQKTLTLSKIQVLNSVPFCQRVCPFFSYTWLKHIFQDG